MGALVELSGRSFGRLTCISRAPNRSNKTMWTCRCECGGESIVPASNLVNGHTQSCGCAEGSRTHGMSKSREFSSWANMIQRCTNPKATRYERYGGRGIKVCERWRHGEGGKTGFECFLADIGPRPEGMTLDRIDRDRDYEPGNCRWATPKEQQRNMGRNRLVEIDGERLPMVAAAEKAGIKLRTLRARLVAGFSDADALATTDFRTIDRGEQRNVEASSK